MTDENTFVLPPLWREAAKIDKLLKGWSTTKDEKKTPELTKAFEELIALAKDKPEIDNLTPWLWRGIQKGILTIDHDIISDEQGILEVSHIADWYNSKAKSRKGVDIMQMGPEDLRSKMDEFDQELMDKDVKEVERDKSVIYKFEDGSVVRQIQNGDECMTNGSQMGNCLKEHTYGYPGKVDSGATAILELLDPRGKPQLSIEIQPTRDEKLPNGLADPRGGNLIQVQGKDDKPGGDGFIGDRLPTDELQGKLREFFQSVKVEDRPGITTGNPRTINTPKDMAQFRQWDAAGQDEEIRWGADSLGEDYAIPRTNPNEDDHGYISSGQADEASAAYGVPVRGKDAIRGGDFKVDEFANNILKGKEYDQKTLTYVKDVLEREGKLEEFTQALHELQPEMEKHFYMNVYDSEADPDEGVPDDERTYHQQWRDWPMSNTFKDLTLSRDPARNPAPAPAWAVHPNQMGFPDMPAPQKNFPAQTASVRKQGIAPVYYRWTFSPRTGVSLGHNEGDLDAFVQYREGSSDSDDKGYAYRIGNGWRLTDWEHRPVEDPYVVSQVVRKLQDQEQAGKKRARVARRNTGRPRRPMIRRPKTRVNPLWSEVKSAVPLWS